MILIIVSYCSVTLGLFDDIGMAASMEEDPENAAPDYKSEEIPESKA